MNFYSRSTIQCTKKTRPRQRSSTLRPTPWSWTQAPTRPICDILGLDFYPNYKISHPINTKVLKMADQVAKKLSKPVMISETGYPSGPSLLAYSAESQAKYVSDACREAYGLGGVTGIGIWRFIDTAWRSFPPQENHFGLFDNKGKPKAAWSEFSKVIKDLK